jgi:ferritin-like metal-binding protein YciE/gas vesicle protein
MEGAATNPQLKQAFKQHRVETENQIKRLDQIFGSLGESSSGNASKALTGLVAEGQEVISASGEADVIDAGLIGASQKIEHYEIACYGTLIAYARLLRDTQGEKLLQQNLNEEYATDKKLTALAESMVNAKAMQATGNYKEGGSDGGVSVAGLLIGAAAGVAVGMLLAPNAGTDSRKKILDGANTLLDQLGGQFGGLADTVKSTLNQLTGQVQNGGSTTTQSTVKKNNNVKRSNGNGNATPPASPTTSTTTTLS